MQFIRRSHMRTRRQEVDPEGRQTQQLSKKSLLTKVKKPHRQEFKYTRRLKTKRKLASSSKVQKVRTKGTLAWVQKHSPYMCHKEKCKIQHHQVIPQRGSNPQWLGLTKRTLHTQTPIKEMKNRAALIHLIEIRHR